MLKVSQACKRFGDHIVLDHVSFEVETAQIVGLAGPSGGGKSTLLRCIQQLDTLDSGTITCAGYTGFMFQDFQLFPHMTVLQNLVYAPQLHDQQTNHLQAAKKLLKQLGIPAQAKSYPQQLSGGQKQRVALARSLMMQPDLLLCDEPTSGLDVATIAEVVGLLKTVRDMGLTLLIASHDLDFLTQIADRIMLIKAGRKAVDIALDEVKDPIAYLTGYYAM